MTKLVARADGFAELVAVPSENVFAVPSDASLNDSKSLNRHHLPMFKTAKSLLLAEVPLDCFLPLFSRKKMLRG